MSLEVIRAGILDTIQDGGRPGYQHLGINPGGAMDRWAMQAANAVVGNAANEGVIEMSFPAATIRFNHSATICLLGANFSARVNGTPLPNGKLCCVPAGSKLTFAKRQSGRFVYLAVGGGLNIKPWLGSVNTNLKVNAGGLGRALKKGDVIPFRRYGGANRQLKISNWHVEMNQQAPGAIRCINGPEWSAMSNECQQALITENFLISPVSDRMGYRLQGATLNAQHKMELLSTAVTFGTIQILPNGQLIALMADHQTTGGYPRVLQVAAVDLPAFAQRNPLDSVHFEIITLTEAEVLWTKQQQSLRQLQMSCEIKLRD